MNRFNSVQNKTLFHKADGAMLLTSAPHDKSFTKLLTLSKHDAFLKVIELLM